MGRVMLFFGCQYKSMDLYKTDKTKMIDEGVLDKTYLALSREPSVPKVSWDSDNSEIRASYNGFPSSS